MTPASMISVVKEIGQAVSVDENVVEFAFESIPMVLVFDVDADRMRILSPIVEVGNLEPGQIEAAMAANFHSSLDARYAFGNGLVWSAFIHPLEDLSEALLRSAIRQVAVARATFGSEYTSGELVYARPPDEDDDGTVN